MSELVHPLKNWLVLDAQKNICLWPKSKKIVILDLALGWLMAGLSFGVVSIMFIYNEDIISRFVCCPLVAFWGIGFFIYGLLSTNIYLEEFMKIYRNHHDNG
jgi:hypothetical protein